MNSEDWADRALEKLRSWEGLSKKSRKRKISSLNGFLKWLKSYEHIDIEILVDAPNRIQHKLPNFISLDECMSLIQYLEKNTKTEKAKQQKLLICIQITGTGNP